MCFGGAQCLREGRWGYALSNITVLRDYACKRNLERIGSAAFSIAGNI